MTKPLSPAAQAVEDAYFNADGFGYRNGLAAVLRAAADQAVPEVCFESDDITTIRDALLAIAAELEAH
jgi:hypothetical protein